MPRFFSRLLIASVLTSSIMAAAAAQQVRQPFSRVAVTVTPDRPDWTYQPGEPVTFRVDVVRDGHQVTGATVKYGIGPEMLPPATEATATAGAAPLMIKGGTMKEPGFLRLVATAVIWLWILDPQFGIVNQALLGLGLPAPGWASSARLRLSRWR